MQISDVVAGRAGLAGVRWVLLGAHVRRGLRDVLRTAVSAPNVLGTCRLRRAKLKPGRKLSAWYDVYVRTPGAAQACRRPLAVTWTLPAGGPAPDGMSDLASAQAAALHRGLAAPFERLWGEVPAWGMHIRISPLDEKYAQLGRVCDPRHVREMLAAAGAATAGQPASWYTITPIRYRPGERHVLRYDAVGPMERTGAWNTVFAKLYRDEEGAPSVQVAAGVADWLAACGSDVSAVRPLAYVAADSVALYPRVAGSPLAGHLRTAWPAPAKHLAAAGAALHALQRAPVPLAAGLEAHDFATELRAIARACEHISALLPAAGAMIDEILDRAQELHVRLPPEPPTFAHGDFKADHVLVSPAGLRLIDFDSCCRADPALDVGKFLADLQWWYTAYAQPGLERAQLQFLDGYADGAARGPPAARLARARLYEAIVLVKLTAHRVRLFDTDWAPRTEHMIGRARTGLQTLLQDLVTAPARRRTDLPVTYTIKGMT